MMMRCEIEEQKNETSIIDDLIEKKRKI